MQLAIVTYIWLDSTECDWKVLCNMWSDLKVHYNTVHRLSIHNYSEPQYPMLIVDRKINSYE